VTLGDKPALVTGVRRPEKTCHGRTRATTPPNGWSRHGVRHGSGRTTGCAPHGPRLAATWDSTC
jgi:hypothetical protein